MSTPRASGHALPPPTVEEVDDGIFAYIQLDGSWYLNNAGFLLGRDGVTVIDSTSTESRGRALVAAIESISTLPTRVLVNTHHHGDHTHGNFLFPAAAIIGHERCRQEVMAAGVSGQALFPDVDWGDLRVAPPFVTFSERLTIHVDDLRVELAHTGPAHTDNDVYAWIGERRLLFSGDLLFNGVTPLLAMGSISGALVTLEELRSLGPAVVVPGHGPVGGPEVIDEVEAYVRFVSEVAEAGRSAGASPLDAARQADLGRFAEWPDQERLVGNLYRAYAELDGTPPGAPIDLRAAFADMVAFNGGHPLRCLA